MFGIQPIHILIIIIVALLIFGPRKLPEMGRSIGKAFSEFRKGTSEITDSFRDGAGMTGTAGTTNTIAPPPASIAAPQPAPGNSIPAPSPSVVPAPAGNFCVQCGAPNAVDALFCNHCGMKMPVKTS
jgi:sec-independent protein translocase protein TatA